MSASRLQQRCDGASGILNENNGVTPDWGCYPFLSDFIVFNENSITSVISLHIRSIWETTVMHKQVSGWTVNFDPNSDARFGRILPPPSPLPLPFRLLRNSPPHFGKLDLGWPKFTLEYPPPMKIVRESKSEIFRIPRVTTCGDFMITTVAELLQRWYWC